jgi:hypothetical protein
MKLHTVFVAQVSHDLDLLDEALFSLVLTVGCFFGKCLDGKVFSAF